MTFRLTSTSYFNRHAASIVHAVVMSVVLAFSFDGATAAYAQQPTPQAKIENIRVQRTAGAIEVSYDLVADDPRATFAIALEALDTKGQPVAAGATDLSGDTGPGVRAGLGKKAVWKPPLGATGTPMQDIGAVRVVIRPTVTPTRAALSSIRITTEPSAARVLIDDLERGETPLTVSDVSPGKHTITLIKEGYADSVSAVEAQQGTSQSVHTQLQALAAKVGGGSEPGGPQVAKIGGGSYRLVASLFLIGGGSTLAALAAVGPLRSDKNAGQYSACVQSVDFTDQYYGYTTTPASVCDSLKHLGANLGLVTAGAAVAGVGALVMSVGHHSPPRAATISIVPGYKAIAVFKVFTF